MRILIDTNVLISAFVFGGKAGKVLSDVIFHKADIILSGDKDFLESELEKPQVFSPAMLFDYFS